MARVCIIRHNYYPQETHVRRDAEALQARGHDVTIICLRARGQPAHEVVGDAHVYRLPVEHHRRGVARYLYEYGAFFLLATAVVSFLHLRRRFDTVEVDTMPDILVFAAVLPKVLGARVVLYLFEAMPEFFAAQYSVVPEHPAVCLLALIEQMAIGFADQAITVSEVLRARFVARGAPSDKISVILNVPDERVFWAPACSRGAEQRAGDGLALITHGTLTEMYGVQVAIRAVSRLKGRLPGLRLLIVGDGEYRPTLEAMARELQVEDCISFTGWVPQEQVAAQIRAADVGLVPILAGYGEVMVPNKLLEYVASGRPAIVSSLAGIRSYFDGTSLAFHEAGDDEGLAMGIELLYWDRDWCESLARQAYRVYEAHRWGRSQETYCAILAPPWKGDPAWMPGN